LTHGEQPKNIKNI